MFDPTVLPELFPQMRERINSKPRSQRTGLQMTLVAEAVVVQQEVYPADEGLHQTRT
jgi:hypothetical protein